MLLLFNFWIWIFDDMAAWTNILVYTSLYGRTNSAIKTSPKIQRFVKNFGYMYTCCNDVAQISTCTHVYIAMLFVNISIFFYYYRGFQAYLNGAPNYNFPMYRQLVHEITQTFSKISQDIILITKHLEEDHNLTTIATIVTGIQNNEKDKLEKVCEAVYNY